MTDHPLGEYANCPWCGKEHELDPDDGISSKGWAVTEVYFDREAFIDTTSRQKPYDYLCDQCAEIAANGRELLEMLQRASVALTTLIMNVELQHSRYERGIADEVDTLITKFVPEWMEDTE